MAEQAVSARPRLRPPGPAANTAPIPTALASPVPFTLAIAGVVVTRAQLVAALQPFLPQLTDIQPFEDGERFLFVMHEEPAPRGPRKEEQGLP